MNDKEFDRAVFHAENAEIAAVLATIAKPATLALEPMNDKPAKSLRGNIFDARHTA